MSPRASGAFWRLSSWSCVLGLLLAAGCRTAPPPGLELVRRSEPLLGTFVTVTLYAPTRARGIEAGSAAFDEFRRIDALMSVHRPDSELSQLNARAAAGAVTVSPDLFRVIAAAQKIAEESNGSFDITIRPLVDLWGFLWKQYRLPTREELQAVLPRVRYTLVELDPERRTVRFGAPGVSLDLGGIAKGYAVDCAVERLRALGITNAMVKAGGDLRVTGAPPGRSNWIVQLEDPRKEGRRLQVPLLDAALSTSGNYENFFELNGRRYSHILNPRTGQPIQGVAACTVIAPTCMESDALATACFAFGVENSLARFGNRYPLRFTLSPTGGREAPWPIRQTPSFPACNSGHSRPY